MPARADRRLSAEFRLLAAALRPPAQPGGPAAVRAAATPEVDWASLLRLADRHRVRPGLAAGLERAGVKAPQEQAEMLRAGLTRAAFDELSQAASIRRILAAFTSENLPIGVLKGVPLSLAIHGRLGLRISRDIDLIVAPADVPRALALLGTLGFAPAAEASEPDFPRMIRRRKDIELFAKDRRQVVELHWRLFDNPHLLPASAPLPFAWVSLPFGIDCLTLPQRLNLLYLAGHGAHHGWSRLKWLADIAALLDGLGEDGREALYAGATLAEGRRALGQALLLCADLFGMDAPASLRRDAARDWRLGALRALALRSMARSGEREIEAVRFGTTAKNVSHYLIRTAPAYLAAELRYDLADFSSVRPDSSWRRLGPVGRLGSWLQRHVLAGR